LRQQPRPNGLGASTAQGMANVSGWPERFAAEPLVRAAPRRRRKPAAELPRSASAAPLWTVATAALRDMWGIALDEMQPALALAPAGRRIGRKPVGALSGHTSRGRLSREGLSQRSPTAYAVPIRQWRMHSVKEAFCPRQSPATSRCEPRKASTERRVIVGTLIVSSRRPLRYRCFIFCRQVPPPTEEALSHLAVRRAPWELHPPVLVTRRWNRLKWSSEAGTALSRSLGGYRPPG